MPNVSENGLALVKAYEGFSPTAYKCPAGVWTIGWGDTRNVKKGDTITPAQAEERLRDTLGRYAEAVAPLVNRPLNQNETDALASFAFNLGLKAFETSTLRKDISAARPRGDIEEQFLRWRYATVNGKKQEFEGLRRRRAAEAALFFAPLGAVSVSGQDVIVKAAAAATTAPAQVNQGAGGFNQGGIVWQHASNTQQQQGAPAGTTPIAQQGPCDMPQAPEPPPQKPIAASRTVWGTALAGLSGVSAWITEMQGQVQGIGGKVTDLLGKLKIPPGVEKNLPTIFICLFLVALALVVFARVDDQARRAR